MFIPDLQTHGTLQRGPAVHTLCSCSPLAALDRQTHMSFADSLQLQSNVANKLLKNTCIFGCTSLTPRRRCCAIYRSNIDVP